VNAERFVVLAERLARRTLTRGSQPREPRSPALQSGESSRLLLLLSACSGLEASPDLEGFQLIQAEELRLILRNQDGTPFEGSLRVFSREAPVVAGRTYLPIRGLVPSRDPDLDTDPWCTGTAVQVEWWDGRHEEGRGGLFRTNGLQAALFLVPRAIPYPVPTRAYWALVWTPEGLTKRGNHTCFGRPTEYDLELRAGWNLVYAEPALPDRGAWVYGRQEAYWRVDVR